MELATSAGSRPRFRTDLVAECIDDGGQRFIDVIDPDTGDAFRFYEVEYSLACAMDGERDVAGLVQWAKEELGIEPSRSELENVITTLGDLGYLDRASATSAASAAGAVELGLSGGTARATEPSPIAHEDFELGVSGGTPAARAHEAAEDIELGMPGAMAAAPEPVASLRRGPSRPDADEDGPTALPHPEVGDFDDDEVSVDLSEHLSLKPDDVKEAVRMSRSMKAVDVPQDLLDEIGQKEADAARKVEEAKQAATLRAPEVEPELPPRREEPKPPPPIEVARPAVELPKDPVVVAKKPPPVVKPPEPKPPVTPPPVVQEKKGVSTWLIVLLVLAVLGAGGYYVWAYVINKADDSTETPPPVKTKPPVSKGSGSGTASASGTAAASASGTGTSSASASGTGAASASASGTGAASASGTGTSSASASGTGAASASASGSGTGSGSATTPPPAAGPTAKLESVPGSVDVTATKDGSVVFVAKSGPVKAGDPLVQLQGVQPLKTKLGDAHGGLEWDINSRVPRQIEKAQAQLAAATQSGNKAAAKAAQATIDERTKRLGEKNKEADGLRAAIAELTVAAPSDGEVTMSIKNGARVHVGDKVAAMKGPDQLGASFTVTDGSKYQVGADASVSKGGAAATCKVAKVDDTTVVVVCPSGSDAGLAAGDEVTLQ